ncbi:MAG: hypothetical protein AAGB93_07005 [Planctomycetota bacterium]
MSADPSSPHEPRPGPLPAEWLDLIADEATGRDADQDPRAARLLGRAPSDEERAALRRALGHVAALRSLERCDAPATLEGRAVAGLEAGHRQDRAASVLSSLPRLSAPAALDDLVRDVADRDASEPTAPAVLDRLVEERIGDPEGSMSRSMAGRLGRRRAPSDLDERVLRSPARIQRLSVARWVASAAAAIVLVVSLRMMETPEAPEADAPEVEFRITRIDSLAAAGLSSSDRIFLSSLTGESFGR